MTPDIEKLTKIASQVRRDIVRMVHARVVHLAVLII
jgi:hypothetical protein